MYESSCQAAVREREGFCIKHCINLCPWGKEELKKYSFPCVYTTDPNSSKGAFRINWESALCCKRSLNTYLPNPGFKHHSEVCLWQLWSCRHHGVSRQRIHPLPTAPRRVDVPRSTVTTLDLAIAAPFLHPNPCTARNQWLHQPNRFGGFLPISMCNFTSDGFIVEGFPGSPWEKFLSNLQKWLSWVNPSIFKKSWGNFLFQGWFWLRSVPSNQAGWIQSHQISSIGFCSLFAWVQRVQNLRMGWIQPLVYRGTRRLLARVHGPLEWKGMGSIVWVAGADAAWTSTSITYKYYTHLCDTEIILQLCSRLVLRN